MGRSQTVKKWIIAGIACIIALLMLGFVMKNAERAKKNTVTAEEKRTEEMVLWIVSDVHFLSPDLTDGGPLFTRTIENGDGKMVSDSPEIIDALVGNVLAEKPDALILSGDLTFNGEKESLRDLAGRLEAVRKAGIPVLLIPGNHDIEYPYACRYRGEQAEAVEGISEEDFKDICGEFGYNSAAAKDDSSFSYLYPLTDDLCVLLLDANTKKNPGEISENTLKWAEEQLEWTREKGMDVISVTHQNLLPQNQLLSAGFVLRNYKEVFQLLQKYKVKMHFSGHSHIQHSRTENGLTDVAVGSLTVAPLRYGMIKIDEEHRVSYEPGSLDILQDEARDFFDLLTARQVMAELDTLSLTQTIQNDMRDFAVEVNRKYFAGTLTDTHKENLRQSRIWVLWKENARGTFWYYYLDSILNGQD